MGLGLDDWDLDYYTNLFVKDIKRNPDERRMLRPLPVEQRTLAPLVLQGQADRRREGNSRDADEDRESHVGGKQEQQHHCLQRQLQRDNGLRHHNDRTAAVGKPSRVPGGKAEIPYHLHGRDPQLPLGRRAVPRRRNRHRRPHPGRPGNRHRRARHRRHRGVLRGQSPHSRV